MAMFLKELFQFIEPSFPGPFMRLPYKANRLKGIDAILRHGRFRTTILPELVLISLTFHPFSESNVVRIVMGDQAVSMFLSIGLKFRVSLIPLIALISSE